MKKRLISMLMVTIMLLGTMSGITVMADNTAEAEISTVNWWATQKGTSSFTAGISTTDAYSGDKSLHITFDPTSNKNDYVFIGPNTKLLSLEDGKEYTISAKVKRISGTAASFYDMDSWGRNPILTDDTSIGGWVNVKITDTFSTSYRGMFMMVLEQNGNYDATEFYIDDIVIKNDGVVIYEETFGDTEESLSTVKWWASQKGTSPYTAGISTAESCSGDKSLHITFAPTSNKNDYVFIGPNDELLTLIDGNNYTVTAKVKRIKGTAASFCDMNGWGRNPILTDDTPIGEWVDVEVSDTFATGYRKNFMMSLEQNGNYDATEFYIDDIVIKNDGVVVYTENFGDVEPEKPSIPDITTKDISNVGWVPASTGKIGDLKYTANVSAREANSGKKSLHITVEPAETGYVFLRPNNDELGTFTPGETYTVTAYVKRIKGVATAITGWIDWSKTRILDTTLGEWEQVTASGVCSAEGDSNMRFQITLEKNKIDGVWNLDPTELYIDDIVIMENDEVIYTESFEDITTGTETFGAVVFDEELNKITDLTSDLSGKAVIAAATVANYDADSTAQLLVGIYKGTQLIDCELSEIVPATKDGTAVDVQAEITLPEFTDSDDISIKVFVWDSFDGMYPYTTVKEIK